jgi:hypothetical protein
MSHRSWESHGVGYREPPGPSRRRVRSPTWLAWGPSLSVVAVLLVNLVLFELPDQIRSPATKGVPAR